MLIYFVRHGETNANQEGYLNGGGIDEPLTEKGVDQVREIAEKLPHDIDVIVASSMKRTRQSAEIIAEKTRLPVFVEEDLVEQDFGSQAGKKFESIPDFDLSVPLVVAVSKYDFAQYGGESETSFKSRVKKAVETIKAKHDGKVVLVVGHGGVLWRMYQLYSKEPKTEILNASIHTLSL